MFVGLILVALIPVLYGAYLLFQPEPPSLTSVEPARIQSGQTQVLTVRGNNLRPYMRVSFDAHQGKSFLFADSTRAVVELEAVPPGVYDVILYDHAQERFRIPKGLEVVALPRPQTSLDLVGRFTAIAENIIPQLKPDVALAGLGTILQVGAREASVTRTQVGPNQALNVPSTSAFNVPAVIRATCTLVIRAGVAICMTSETGLTRDNLLTVNIGNSTALFQIDQVRAAAPGTLLDVRVRLAGDHSVLALLRQGDVDQPRSNPFATGASIARLGAITPPRASVVVSSMLSPQGDGPAVLAGDISTVDALLRISADRSENGWSYQGQTLKAGRVLALHAPGYEVSGTILGVVEARPAK